ncbi:DUF2283 domain-containing protein [Prosthecobacter sp.]|uniref:DUF2283 domain-containing protein n=1 Tax=Prosthecobacter sp. TaxID=1965333 RepID=UPI002AB88D3A|nr:DUF2283 domain-containing protein [Prosthecobacter sp.]MDZ4403632.1 DUF2283 domain-containing protein [Prosthecobacter sp.]
MKENHTFFVQSKTAPTVEIDFDSHAAYVRFKSGKVAKTIAKQTAGGMHLAIDFDSRGEVIGIESIGFNEFNLSKVVAAAKVDAPNVDFSKAKIRSTPHREELCAA